MNVAELRDAITAAKSKDALEKLVMDELGIDIDKRTRFDDLKADLLESLDEGLQPAEVVKENPEDLDKVEDNRDDVRHDVDKEVIAEGTATDVKAGDGDIVAHSGTDHKDGQDIVSSAKDPDAPDESRDGDEDPLLDISLPHIDQAENVMPAPAKDMRHGGVTDTTTAPKTRLLRHKQNGREMVWTPALAGHPDLEEV